MTTKYTTCRIGVDTLEKLRKMAADDYRTVPQLMAMLADQEQERRNKMIGVDYAKLAKDVYNTIYYGDDKDFRNAKMSEIVDWLKECDFSAIDNLVDKWKEHDVEPEVEEE